MTEADMLAGTKRGDRRATEALLRAHEPLMRSLVLRWTRLVALDDLLQCARESTLRAAALYDADKGAAFPRYAARRIRADVRRMARRWASDVKEDGWATGTPEWKRQAVVAERYEHHDTMAPEDALGLLAHAPATQEAPLDVRDIRMALRVAMPSLTPRERSVVSAFLSDPDATGEEVATTLSMGTRQNVRHAQRKAFNALRQHPTIRAVARDFCILEAA